MKTIQTLFIVLIFSVFHFSPVFADTTLSAYTLNLPATKFLETHKVKKLPKRYKITIICKKTFKHHSPLIAYIYGKDSLLENSTYNKFGSCKFKGQLFVFFIRTTPSAESIKLMFENPSGYALQLPKGFSIP